MSGFHRVTRVTALGGTTRTKERGRRASAPHSAWSPIRAARQPARCAVPAAELPGIDCVQHIAAAAVSTVGSALDQPAT